jgi:menaquinone-dependent protoporphyrinogen oxidase
MSTLIAYATNYGCTEKIVRTMAESLPKAQIVNLKKDSIPDLAAFDTVLLGGSIRAGRIQKSVTNFCQERQVDLLKKKLGLFLVCMEEGEKAQTQYQDAFPEELRKHASAQGFLGGEFDFSKMNFIEKAVIKKIAHIDKSVSRINDKAIKDFVKMFKS